MNEQNQPGSLNPVVCKLNGPTTGHQAWGRLQHEGAQRVGVRARRVVRVRGVGPVGSASLEGCGVPVWCKCGWKPPQTVVFVAGPFHVSGVVGPKSKWGRYGRCVWEGGGMAAGCGAR